MNHLWRWKAFTIPGPLSSYGVGGPSWRSLFTIPGSYKPGMAFGGPLGTSPGDALRKWIEVHDPMILFSLFSMTCLGNTVDKFFFTWVPIKKTTQGRPNECQILYLGITIKLIDRS
jgi:hypothetical protein